jgi:hypothetical protein
MDYVRIIATITLCASILFSKTLLASCYEASNAFDDDGNITGLAVTFSNSTTCTKSSPYEIFISRNSTLRNSAEIKFTISELDVSLLENNSKNIVRFYSNQDLLHEIYIKNTSVGEISSNTYLSNVTPAITKVGTTYTLSNIEFNRVSKIQFGDDDFVGKIDDIQYATNATNDSDFQPIIVIKPYKTHPENQAPTVQTMKLAAIPTKLIDGIIGKSIIYYNHNKSNGANGEISCNDTHEEFGDLGYYFAKDEEKTLHFEGCCFPKTYGEGVMQNPLQTNASISYDAEFVGIGNKTISNEVRCIAGRSVSGQNLSYYFNEETCNIELAGNCTDDGAIPNSALITVCSTKQVGDVVQKSDGTDIDKEILCKIGCENSDELDKLKYNLSSSTAMVTISGSACNKKTKTLHSWALLSETSIPKGINSVSSAEYMFNEDVNTLNCIPGYEDGTITYKFQENQEIIIFTGSCTPKEYRLDSYSDWASISGLTNSVTVDYNEDINSVIAKGSLSCDITFSPNAELGYYFADQNGDGESNLIITGNCIANICVGSLANENKPPYTRSEDNLNAAYSVNSTVTFECDDSNGYIPVDGNPPKLTCQTDGIWSTPSSSCVMSTCLNGTHLPSVINGSSKVNYSGNFGTDSNYNFGKKFDLSCNSSAGYVQNGSAPNIECAIGGWELSPTSCQFDRCSKEAFYNAIDVDRFTYLLSPDQDDYAYDDTVPLSCNSDNGYVGSVTSAKCAINNQWNKVGGVCTLNTLHCSSTPTGLNAKTEEISDRSINATNTINCNSMHVGENTYGNNIILTCKSNGSWGVSENCISRTCSGSNLSSWIGESGLHSSSGGTYDVDDGNITFNICKYGYIKANNSHPYAVCRGGDRYEYYGDDNCVVTSAGYGGLDGTVVQDINYFDSNELYSVFRYNNTVRMTTINGNWTGSITLPEIGVEHKKFIFTRNAEYTTNISYAGAIYPHTPDTNSTTTFEYYSGRWNITMAESTK